jgi:transcriptional regulator with GAF, ATPase, and Fis domain
MVEVFPPEMENTIEAALQKTLGGKTINIPDTQLHFPDRDKQVWLEITFAPLRTPQRRLIGVVANVHDITQRKVDEKERELLLSAEKNLHRSTREISSLLDLNAIVETTNRLITEISGGEFSGILILDPDTGKPLEVAYHQAPPEAPVYTYGSEEGLTGKILSNREVVVMDDYSAHPKALPFWKEYGIKAVMSVPLQTSDSLMGSITVFSRDPEKKFSARDQEQAISISRQASNAQGNAL